MKLKITFVMTALLSVMGAKADVIPSKYYSKPAAGTFYIYNVNQQKFLRTQGIKEYNNSLVDYPVEITLSTPVENDAYKGGGTLILSAETGSYIKIGYWDTQWLWNVAPAKLKSLLAT